MMYKYLQKEKPKRNNSEKGGYFEENIYSFSFPLLLSQQH